MKDFFLANLLVDLHLYKEAEEAYKILLNNGLQSSQYILGQIAICQHNCKGKWIQTTLSICKISDL